MKRGLIIALIVLMGYLQYQLWLTPGGLLDLWRLHKKVQAQLAHNQDLQDQNAKLKAEVADLRSGKAAIEERARSELGLIKQGETYYQFVKDKS